MYWLRSYGSEWKWNLHGSAWVWGGSLFMSYVRLQHWQQHRHFNFYFMPTTCNYSIWIYFGQHNAEYFPGCVPYSFFNIKKQLAVHGYIITFLIFMHPGSPRLNVRTFWKPGSWHHRGVVKGCLSLTMVVSNPVDLKTKRIREWGLYRQMFGLTQFGTTFRKSFCW